MARPFGYKLSFKVEADTGPAIRSLAALQGAFNRATSGGGAGAARRVTAEQQQAAAIAGTTQATQDKQKATEGGLAALSRQMNMYWKILSLFYLLRNAIQLITNAYRMLWTVVQKGIGIMLALGKAVVQNTADFETLRVKLQAIAPTAEAGSRAFEKLKRWVIGMPFTLLEAAQAFTYLEATGVRATMGLFRSMRVTAAMAKVMDRDLKSASLAIAKFAAGSMQRLTRGFAITGTTLVPYGAAPGVAPGTLAQQTAEDRARNVEALYRYVEDKWGTIIDRLRNTWTQLVNDMTDIWQQFMAAIGEAGILNAMKDLLRYFRDMYEILRDKGVVDKWAKSISDAWKPIVESVGPWMQNLPGLMDTVVGYIVKLGERTDAWLTSMGGVQGLWTRITNTIVTTGPQVLEILRAYFNLMTGIGAAMSAMAGVEVLTKPLAYIPLLGGAKPWAETFKGLFAATRAQGQIRKSVGRGIDSLIQDLSSLNLAGGAMGMEGFKPYDYSTTGGGEARKAFAALNKMDEAVKAGAKEGVKEGLAAVFSKGDIAKGGPFVALYEAMMGVGRGGGGGGGGGGYLADLQRRMAAAPGYRAGGDTRWLLSFQPKAPRVPKTLLERGLTVGPAADMGNLTRGYTALGLMGAIPRAWSPGLAFIGEEASLRRRGQGRSVERMLLGNTGIIIRNYIGEKELKTLAQDAVIDRSPAVSYGVP